MIIQLIGVLPVPTGELQNKQVHKLSQMLNVYNPPKIVGRQHVITYNTSPKKSGLPHSQNVVWLGLKRTNSLMWKNIYTKDRISQHRGSTFLTQISNLKPCT